MRITKVKFYDLESKNANFLAKCSVVLDDSFVLHDIKVLTGKKGRYIIMPEKSNAPKNKENSRKGECEDIFHPVNKDFFDYMSKTILDGYSIYERSSDKIYFPKECF